MSELNPQQLESVRHLGSPLLVLAGAGSGKTRVITHKLVYLIKELGVPARHIAAITFTNKAAREMKQRAAELLDRGGMRGLTVCTFHALGLDMVRREHRLLGFKPGFSILDTADSLNVIKELLRKQDSAGEADIDEIRQAISGLKNAFITPARALQQADTEHSLHVAKIFERYQRQLRAYNALDFDDLILQPVALLHQHEAARERWRQRIRHLLVDEYQDTNACQYEFLKLLMSSSGHFTAVGDDDQSIYAWRGAQPQNLARLSQDLPNLKVVKLEQNYRSTGRILAAANALIAVNPHLFVKRLWSSYGPGDRIRVIPCQTPDAEAERVVGEILRRRFTDRVEFGAFAVLYRGNHQAKPFERLLREQEIPYVLSGGQSFFDRSEVKDTLAYLRLLANPDDDTAFLRIINTPRREIGPNTLEKLGEYATRREIGLLAASSELGLATVLPTRGYQRLSTFAEWMQSLITAAQTDHPVRIAQRLLAESGYHDWLLESSKNSQQAEKRQKNVQEVLNWMENLARSADAERSVSDLVRHMALMDILERSGNEDTPDRVHLMTLHAAKGLEFDQVFLVGFEEGLLPHENSMSPEQLEEERRLAYVGITRARRRLTITFAAKRTRGGESIAVEPSRFLAELPEEHLDFEDTSRQPSREESRETGRAHLSRLKDMIGPN